MTSARGEAAQPGRAGRTAAPPVASGILRSPYALLLASAVLVAVHIGWASPVYPMGARLASAGLGVLALFSLQRLDRRRLPFEQVVLTGFYVYFGVAVFFSDHLRGVYGPIAISDSARTAGTVAALLAALTLYATLALITPLARRLAPLWTRVLPRVPASRCRAGIRLWAVVSLVIQVAQLTLTSHIPASLGFFIGLIGLNVTSQVLLYADWADAPTPTGWLWFAGYTVATMGIQLGSGMLEFAIRPLLMAAFLVWVHGGRIRLRLPVAAVLLFLVLNPAKHRFRAMAWNPLGTTSQAVPLSTRFNLWVEALEASWGSDSNTDQNLEGARKRVTSLLTTAHVLDWTPRWVPYAGLARWNSTFASWIPRALWPGKPGLTDHNSSRYAIAFGLGTTESVKHVAVDVPFPADGYWALGWPGVALIGALAGLLLGLYRGSLSPQRWTTLVVATPLIGTLYPQGPLANYYSGVPQAVFVSVLALWGVYAVSLVLQGSPLGSPRRSPKLASPTRALR